MVLQSMELGMDKAEAKSKMFRNTWGIIWHKFMDYVIVLFQSLLIRTMWKLAHCVWRSCLHGILKVHNLHQLHWNVYSGGNVCLDDWRRLRGTALRISEPLHAPDQTSMGPNWQLVLVVYFVRLLVDKQLRFSHCFWQMFSTINWKHVSCT